MPNTYSNKAIFKTCMIRPAYKLFAKQVIHHFKALNIATNSTITK